MLQLLHVLRIDLTKYLSIKYPSIYRYLQIVIDFFYKCSVYHSFLCRWWKRSFTDAENWPLTKKKKNKIKKLSGCQILRRKSPFGDVRELEDHIRRSEKWRSPRDPLMGGADFVGLSQNLRIYIVLIDYDWLWIFMMFMIYVLLVYDVYDICVCVCFSFWWKKNTFSGKSMKTLW